MEPTGKEKSRKTKHEGDQQETKMAGHGPNRWEVLL